jgi:UDP-glucose 4-epimerase
MSRILVIGGTGGVGTSLVEALLEKGYDVSMLVHKNVPRIRHANLKTFAGDVLDKPSLHAAFECVDTVVNMVGQITVPREYYALNSIGILNVLDECADSGVGKVVFTSSAKVYGEGEEKFSEESEPSPVSQEGVIKLMAENMHRHFSDRTGVPVVCLRLSNVYGPSQTKGVVFNFVRDAKKGAVTINGDGTQERVFVHADDVATAIISAIGLKSSGFEVFNISSDESVMINELLRLVQDALGTNAKVVHRDFEAPEEGATRTDYSKAKRILGYASKIRFEDGIRKVCTKLSEGIA